MYRPAIKCLPRVICTLTEAEITGRKLIQSEIAFEVCCGNAALQKQTRACSHGTKHSGLRRIDKRRYSA